MDRRLGRVTRTRSRKRSGPSPASLANLERGRRLRGVRGSVQLTPAVRRVLVFRLATGSFVGEASAAAGIAHGTLDYWLRRARAGAAPYQLLLEALREGQAVRRRRQAMPGVAARRAMARRGRA